MMRSATTMAAVVVGLVVMATGLASAATGGNGMGLNGMGLNGMGLNGMGLNGMGLNGMGLNGMGLNGMGLNGMGNNGLGNNGLDLGNLTADTLSTDSLLDLSEDTLRDPVVRNQLEYIVSCALAEDQAVEIEVDGELYYYPGHFALAPEWGEPQQRCDATCQRWVSACLLARINAKGDQVLISLRGARGGLALEPGEAKTFTVAEATYYGNLFDRHGSITACLAPGVTELRRPCGDSLEDCPFDVMGACDHVCETNPAGHLVCVDAYGQWHEETVSVWLDPAWIASQVEKRRPRRPLGWRIRSIGVTR